MRNKTYKYIQIVYSGPSPSRKTKRWKVESKDGSTLGFIKWYSPWRKYAFFSLVACFEEECLRDISDFLETETKNHKSSLQQRKLQ